MTGRVTAMGLAVGVSLREDQLRVGLPRGLLWGKKPSIIFIIDYDIHIRLGSVFGPKLAFCLVQFTFMHYQISANKMDNF